jgi:GH18 family chitinase
MSLFSLKLVKFLRKHNFDGVLIDYEFPNMKSRGSPEYSKPGFTILLKVKLTLLEIFFFSIK